MGAYGTGSSGLRAKGTKSDSSYVGAKKAKRPNRPKGSMGSSSVWELKEPRDLREQ